MRDEPSKGSQLPLLALFILSLFGVLSATLATCYMLPILQGDRALYISANYSFHHKTFANDWGTIGTDYGLAVAMFLPALHLLRSSPQSSRDLSLPAACLLLLYSLSVITGGACHHSFTTLESMNTATFRALWTVCVGSVTAAGAFLGICGSALAKVSSESPNRLFRVLIVPRWWWYLYGGALTALVAAGRFSMERPAADIFLAGITQTPPTVYTVVAMASNSWGAGTLKARLQLAVGSFLNAPLLPLYGILVRRGLPLGVVNTILHCNLLLAWGLQAMGYISFSDDVLARKIKAGKKA